MGLQGSRLPLAERYNAKLPFSLKGIALMLGRAQIAAAFMIPPQFKF